MEFLSNFIGMLFGSFIGICIAQYIMGKKLKREHIDLHIELVKLHELDQVEVGTVH